MVFNSKGMRENALSKLRPADRVILVGTFGPETAEGDRNRVLGMMEPSQEPIRTADFISGTHTDRRLFNPDGSYRWPFGLVNHRAWSFEPGLFLADVAPRPGNPFGSPAAAGIVALTDDEEKRILAHPHHEIPLMRSLAADRRLYGDAEARRRNAPIPAEGARRGVMHLRRGEAFVYWFQLIANNKIVGHKIGWAFDVELRRRQFIGASLPALGGLQYRTKKAQPMPSARLAFRIEQQVLRIFDRHRHPSNREVLTDLRSEVIEEALNRTIIDVKMGRHLASENLVF